MEMLKAQTSFRSMGMETVFTLPKLCTLGWSITSLFILILRVGKSCPGESSLSGLQWSTLVQIHGKGQELWALQLLLGALVTLVRTFLCYNNLLPNAIKLRI